MSAQIVRKDLPAFQKRIHDAFMTHPVIHENPFTRWFAQGSASYDVVRHFTVQFSVFSNLFLVAQLKKVIHAHSLAEMHAAKEILLNELGVIFRRKAAESQASLQKRGLDREGEGDPEYVNTQGTVDGGVFRFKAAHFEWLLDFARPLGLEFNELGKRAHGSSTTLHFTDALERIYGSEDFSTAAGASYAIENWAAAGFWKDLITGLRLFRERENLELPLSFFTWHDKVEDQHAAHTQDELAEVYSYDDFDEEAFLRAGREMLDACAVFWNGLDVFRLQWEHKATVFMA